MKIKNNIKAFTLIEIIISVSIFSMIMVSIMSVYFTSTYITNKSDINRTLYENIKNVILTISEDIMKNSIVGVSKDIVSPNCAMFSGAEKVISGDKLCLGADYYLAKKDDSGNFIRKDNAFCADAKNICYVVKDGKALTNDLATVSNLNFFITNRDVKKVTMTMTVRPSFNFRLKRDLVKETKIITQLSLSER